MAELSYEVNTRDTTLVLTTYSKKRKVLHRATYQRVPGASPIDLVALNRAVRQLLLAGTYRGTDSLGRAVRMEFTEDQRVKGLKGFKTYDVQTDFMGEAIDYLKLDWDAKHGRTMGFRRTGDTLQLYATREEAYPVPTVVRGRRLFTLVKQ